MTVSDLLSLAYSRTDGVAIEAEGQEPVFMAVMTALEGYGDWIVDSFSVGDGVFGKHSDKLLHLFVYRN